MKLITFAGPPSSGKTSVILKLIEALDMDPSDVGVVKFDCLTSFDYLRYEEAGVKTVTGYSGKTCPDHFFVGNIEDAVQWGLRSGFRLLITESAGLCNRCSPYINGIASVCVIDNLSGVNTPRKIGPMLKLADYVAVTKGDIVSQAEREVFAFNIRQVNASAKLVSVNGITGQGAFMLAKHLRDAKDITTLKDLKLRFTTPAAVCSYCTGETRIGEIYQMGTLKKMGFEL
ncbi:Ni2+-binding GTPase involved in regulation of expression and maturation of urease and hydrogenase [Sporobacter termitidis DSM 10068]|uniref:Ni2+-binding GTPase involved in regulation of expression and maturation of urease and hydrogenase n=1 Tax=Sporobacter termitidis DSM 10068 TaxID=1123282 RepID=A0A1M5Z4Y7_9FIRM|nr:GTP-binding protein [Sporobacter termitidis]SHI19270.1 Ni2+-binding GTPase involved in regulation of expression and maturation of urease and hydrogenase [Sporobacter termitidis DSM 10068]